LPTILELIEAAEQQADDLRAQAAREARDILKSVEEAGAAHARLAARMQAEAVQRHMEAAKVRIGDEIKVLEVRRSAQREDMKKKAAARVQRAGELIFERVVSDGHR
jgi:hypothetical protein